MIQYIAENEHLGAVNLKTREKYREISVEKIKSILAKTDENFESLTEEQKDKHIQYNKKALQQLIKENDDWNEFNERTTKQPITIKTTQVERKHTKKSNAQREGRLTIHSKAEMLCKFKGAVKEKKKKSGHQR